MYKDRYEIMHYKKLDHSTNKKKILFSLNKFNTIKSKFNKTQDIINDVGITAKTVQYHVLWIEKSQVFQLKRKYTMQTNFLLLCFVKYQYYIRNDNLIDCFISIIQSAKNETLQHILSQKSAFKSSSNKAPKEFLDSDEKDALFNEGKFRGSLYKILLFFKLF